jgi:tripartite-type tricarboxylate transporter receptor subunit TctC
MMGIDRIVERDMIMANIAAVIRIVRFAVQYFAVVCVLGLSAISARSETAETFYPVKMVRFIVPFAPGASTDAVARLLGQKLSIEWGQQIIVDNRGGAGGAIGAEFVAKSQPDGYTLLVTNQGPSVMNALLRKNTSYTVDDLTAIVEVGYSPLIIVASPKFSPNSVKELVAYAKANPGKVLIGSSGTNSNVHVALEVLKSVTGTDIVHVPYRGTGPALNDVVAGNINGAYTTTISAEGLVKAGIVKVLGVAGHKRMAVIPDVPTYEELGITGADADVWIGIEAPAKTPKWIVEKVNRDVNKLLQDPDIRARFAQWGLEVEGGTPDHFEAIVKKDVERVNRLIKAGALQIE